MYILVLILGSAFADVSMVQPHDLMPPAAMNVMNPPTTSRPVSLDVAKVPFTCEFCQRLLEHGNMGEGPFVPVAKPKRN